MKRSKSTRQPLVGFTFCDEQINRTAEARNNVKNYSNSVFVGLFQKP